MEEKRISLRVEPQLHIAAKRRMLDETGDDNFQALLHEFLKAYADRSEQVNSPQQTKANHPSTASQLGLESNPDGFIRVSEISSALSLMCRLWEVSPADGRELCTRMEAQIKTLESRLGKIPIGKKGAGKRPA
jgi:hypothetical protein